MTTTTTTTTTELAPREIELLIKSVNARLKEMKDVMESYDDLLKSKPQTATWKLMCNSWVKTRNWGSIEQLRADHQDLADLKMKLG